LKKGGVVEAPEIVPNEAYRKLFKVIFKIEAELREPPNIHAMILYTCAENAFPLVLDAEKRSDFQKRFRTDIPGVKGAFLLSNILSDSESRDFMNISESVGFVPDCPATGLSSTLADNFNFMFPNDFHDLIWNRIKEFLPANALGFNRRVRIYRYKSGNVYRPHIDGAWPGSGLDEVSKKEKRKN
jgi:hypothetical protein